MQVNSPPWVNAISPPGADASALYPSIQSHISAKAVGDEVREGCNLEFESMDWEHVTKYLATNLKPWEARRMKVSDLLPQRTSKRKGGRRPTVTGSSLTKPSYSVQIIVLLIATSCRRMWGKEGVRHDFWATFTAYTMQALPLYTLSMSC